MFRNNELILSYDNLKKEIVKYEEIIQKLKGKNDEW